MSTSKEILFNLLLQANPDLTLTIDEITFGIPTRVTQDEYDTHGRNTRVDITATGTTGMVPLYYDRVILSNLISYDGDPFIPLPYAAYTKVADMLPYINSTYGTNLSTAEVLNDDVDANGGEIAIRPVPGNIGYDGQFYADYPVNAPTALSTVLTVLDIGQIYSGERGLIQRMLNANNGNSVQAGDTDFTLSDFTPVSGQESTDHGGADYKVTVTYAAPWDNYAGSVVVYYSRISIATALGSTVNTTANYLSTGLVNSTDLLPYFASRTTLRIFAEDIVDEALPALSGGTASYDIQAASTSYFYTGTTTVTLVDALPDLSVSFTVTDLPDTGTPKAVGARMWAANSALQTGDTAFMYNNQAGFAFDEDYPYFTTSAVTVNDQSTQDAHGGREASCQITFQPASGFSGSLTLYFNRSDLSALGTAGVVTLSFNSMSSLDPCALFLGNIAALTGTMATEAKSQLICSQELCFLDSNGEYHFGVSAIHDSTWYRNSVDVIVQAGSGGGGGTA